MVYQRKSRVFANRAAWKFPYETRVAACADYLLGKSTREIEEKHGVALSLVTEWIRQRKCFKTWKQSGIGHTTAGGVRSGLQGHARLNGSANASSVRGNDQGAIDVSGLAAQPAPVRKTSEPVPGKSKRMQPPREDHNPDLLAGGT